MLHNDYSKSNMELTGYGSKRYTSTLVMRAQVHSAGPNGARSRKHPIEALLALCHRLLMSDPRAFRLAACIPSERREHPVVLAHGPSLFKTISWDLFQYQWEGYSAQRGCIFDPWLVCCHRSCHVPRVTYPVEELRWKIELAVRQLWYVLHILAELSEIPPRPLSQSAGVSFSHPIKPWLTGPKNEGTLPHRRAGNQTGALLPHPVLRLDARNGRLFRLSLRIRWRLCVCPASPTILLVRLCSTREAVGDRRKWLRQAPNLI